MTHPDAKWFERPERLDTCACCNGRGTITRAYALEPADLVIDSPNEAIRALVVGSADIFTACREAVEIADRSREPVAFRFNGHTVVARHGDNADELARVWWREEYGETPEETQARR